MSPRRNYPKNRKSGGGSGDAEHREINPSNQSFVEDEDGLWVVRQLTGSAANKPYRCPGCDQLIPMATPHTVAWRDGEEDLRRHWHNVCWSKRHHRRPKNF
jgi:hypothetical protein